MTLNWQGKFGEADPLVQEAADLTANLLIDNKVENKSKRDALNRAGRLYQVFGKPDQAAHWQQKLTDFDKAEAENVTGTDALSPKR